MISNYDIDFYDFGIQMLPPDKRKNNSVGFLSALIRPLQWLNDLWFDEYNIGSSDSAFSSASPYSKYDRVIYNKSVYESLIDNNSDIPTTYNWFIVQKNFIGLSERMLYNGQCLVLTYALNKWFGTTFNQPPVQSDIYIINSTIATPAFLVGEIESNSSKISTIESTEFVETVVTYSAQINFTIHVPVAVYNALDTTGINNDKIFRNFVDQYVPAGLFYAISTY
ncbi:MAG: hypothetical protein M3Z26_00520 [Bacteroidota bacterium]|nr:hypothetical protein [Bacteroidota bacterium]